MPFPAHDRWSTYSNRLGFAIADAIHHFPGAIERCQWFIIESMSTRAGPILVVIGIGLKDEP